MPSVPAISYGRAGMYPVERNNSWQTKVHQFCSFQEQRWISQLPRQDFKLRYEKVDGYSVSVLREFFNSVSGMSTTTFALTLGGTTWNNLVFTSDTFEIKNVGKNLFTLELPVRQLVGD